MAVCGQLEMMGELTCAVKASDQLGEAPVWHPALRQMLWLDIRRKILHSFDPVGCLHSSVRLTHQVTAMAWTTDCSLLIAASPDGVGLLNRLSGVFTPKFNPEPNLPGNRSNDGHVDMQGRFWFSTMDDMERSRSGSLYCVDKNWSYKLVLDGFKIPNSIVSEPQGRFLYVADSADQTICKIDADSARQCVRKPFIKIDAVGIYPDGSAVDSQGFLWNAQWGGGRVVRYTPEGEVDLVVHLPVAQPTSCAFGGEGLSTLFITSAQDGLDADALKLAPLSGSLFTMQVDVPGIPLPACCCNL